MDEKEVYMWSSVSVLFMFCAPHYFHIHEQHSISNFKSTWHASSAFALVPLVLSSAWHDFSLAQISFAPSLLTSVPIHCQHALIVWPSKLNGFFGKTLSWITFVCVHIVFHTVHYYFCPYECHKCGGATSFGEKPTWLGHLYIFVCAYACMYVCKCVHLVMQSLLCMQLQA
jgi:hypothetical protein